MISLILLGGGGHCRACVDVIEMERRFKILGIVDDGLEVEDKILGYAVLGDDKDLPGLIEKSKYAFIAVGQIKSAAPRRKLFGILKALGATLPTIVSPLAYVSQHAVLGEGTMAMHGAMINAEATVGANVILNSQSLVEHNVQLSDHCHISTGARVNGGAEIGAGTFIGSGAVIYEGAKIGPNSVIGAGCIVREDHPAETILRASAWIPPQH